AAPRRLLQIDTDRSEIGKTLPADRFILGDAKSTLYALGERISAKTGLPWTGERWAEPARATERTPKVGTVLPQTILRAMTRIAGPDAIVATDVGQHQIWVTKYATFEQPRKFLSSGGMGTMGFGMGAAIGAQLAHPDLPVILVTGDGSFRMNLIELATIKHYRLPVIVVVFHNGALGMVRQMQRESFSRRYSETTTKRGPDIPALANAYGIEGARVRTAEEFETAFVRALGRRIPIVIECPVALDER
ncbi:thiamine pyrophosphate-dependent enzyme, partial [Oscillospiraceae bacterium OttesenSCG-928-G22]|nr:thiamine pyrophosphate-dependent enzyme [Oscillospiraceae bacterium OttesenSCG-928-G22]